MMRGAHDFLRSAARCIATTLALAGCVGEGPTPRPAVTHTGALAGSAQLELGYDGPSLLATGATTSFRVGVIDWGPDTAVDTVLEVSLAGGGAIASAARASGPLIDEPQLIVRGCGPSPL